MTADSEIPSLQAIRSQMSPTRLGDWVLFPDLGLLRRDDEEVRLGTKPLNVLLVLLDAGNRAVSRDEVLDRVWGSQYPTDSVVSRAIADLRSALGESAGEQRYIRTVPKFGYQWVAPATSVEAQSEGEPVSTNRRPAWLITVSLVLVTVVAWQVWNRQQQEPTSSYESSALLLPAARPLTSAPGIEHQPRISPSGEWVVFAALRAGQEDWDLFRTAVGDGSSEPVAVTPGVHEHGPAIAPDGERVAYVRLSPAGCSVVIQSLVLGVPEPVASCTSKFPTLVDWSPESNRLAFTAARSDDKSGRRLLHEVDIDSGQSQTLTHGVSTTGTDFYPRYSPSGQQLAFLRGEPQPDHRSSLWVVDIATGSETRLTDRPAQIGGMAWLDEDSLIYSSGDGGLMQGRILNLATGESRPYEPSGLLHPDYSSDSNLLVAAVSRSERDLYLVEPSGTGRYLAQSTGDEHHARLSPDERLVAFISQRSGDLEVWVADVDTGTTRRLTRFEGLPVRYPDWHPDGQSLMFTVQAEGQERLATVSLLTGEVQLMEGRHEAATTPRWMPDGERWLYGCRDEGSWGICLGSAQSTQRLVDDAFRPVPLTDNSMAVVSSGGQLLEVILDDRSARVLVDEMPGTGRNGWTVDAGRLLYADMNSHDRLPTIIQRDLANGSTQILFSGSLPMADTVISVGQISGSVLFSRYQDASDDVVGFQLAPVGKSR